MKSSIPEESYFFVCYRAQTRIANRLIWQLPDPATAYAVFTEALCELTQNDGVIRLQHRKLANDLGITEDAVFDALNRLHALGILIEHPKGWNVIDKIAINPHVAWKGRPDIRDVHLRTTAPLDADSLVIRSAKEATLSHRKR
ncbi:MAG: hypothetical protein LDL39_18265 [Magnetospirillum sp.]|nr:hypothetical protein [Magnetospirillum sp.]